MSIIERPELSLDTPALRERLGNIDIRAAWASATAPRNCVRCNAETHHGDPPHLCKDVQGRFNAYLTERRQHLLRLIRGRRCPTHGIKLQEICGTKSCSLCYIEQDFRPAKRLAPAPQHFAPKFAGYGRGRQQDAGARAASKTPAS